MKTGSWDQLPAVMRAIAQLTRWAAKQPDLEEHFRAMVEDPVRAVYDMESAFYEAEETLGAELDDGTAPVEPGDPAETMWFEAAEETGDACVEALEEFDFETAIQDFVEFASLTALTYRPRGAESSVDAFLRQRGDALQRRGREALVALADCRIDVVRITGGEEGRHLIVESVLQPAEPYPVRGELPGPEEQASRIFVVRLVAFEGEQWLADSPLGFPIEFADSFVTWLTPLQGDDPPAGEEAPEVASARAWRDAPVLDDRARPGLIAAYLADQWLRGMGLVNLLSNAADPFGDDWDDDVTDEDDR